jgi:cytochrome c
MRALMGYLAAEPAADPKPDAGRGLAVLVQKGCLKCHALHGEGARAAPELADRAEAFTTPAVWAARIWRHTPAMAAVAMERGVLYPRFTDSEMAHLVAYLKTSRRSR